ncbi:MAG TPA: hypothetical protein VMA73_01355 [Streptosporangiaceae bacterium]|nr:hypothetical protein [Streptosporangiaceae bacterium]
MDTLGLWLGPTLAVVIAAIGTRWLGWFHPQSRRRIALRRIAERLASEDSNGYDHLYERYLEHYLGGRDWHKDWDTAWTQDGRNGPVDTRGPAPKWWQRLGARG